MNIVKLGGVGTLKSDTYNGTRKMCRIIFDTVHEAVEVLCKDESDDIRVLEVYCCNHIRNMWLRVMTKSISTLLSNKMM